MASRPARAQAMAAIPLEELEPGAARKVQAIVESASIFRRMPQTTIQVDPDLYLFMIRYPEVIVDVWRLMGISTMTLSRTGPFTLKCNDGAGTTSAIELVYGTPHVHVFVGRGVYTNPRLPSGISGHCVIVLHTDYQADALGRPTATSSIDLFLGIENRAADWIARTLYPLFGSTADHNFVESLKFLEKLSATTLENGPGIQGMAQRLSRVRPEVRERFSQIAGLVYERNRADAAGDSPSAGRRIRAAPTRFEYRPAVVQDGRSR